ncbi:hypothetical protein OHC33_010943 [Knufia fluminis]|uniref:DNA excision repair protein n=2 Tax=Knufia TaxID=430999 RepID=A0AAN8EEV8_9EURO|nr:hypothetical protein OHC33_010943 [Knufia fluminis]
MNNFVKSRVALYASTSPPRVWLTKYLGRDKDPSSSQSISNLAYLSMSSSYDSDDLDARTTKRNTKTHTRSSSSVSFSDAADLSPYGDNEPPRKRRKGKIPEHATKVVWSDSEGEDAGAAAYKKFKALKPNSRKQAMRSTRKAKAIEAENNPPPKKGKDEGHTGVGRQAAKKKRESRIAAYDSGVPSDEEGMDHTMPDYVQDRRNRFNERSEKLKEAGLALPPSYGDIYFSDNERIRSLKERPDLPKITPPAPYKDIELPYSLGIIPASIAQYLRDYQVKGAAFLHELFVYQKGGILGDDMGLGKTIQVIAFLTAMYGKTGDERDAKRMRKMRRAQKPYFKTLIICPGSLMANWQDELDRWGWWHSELFHGSGKRDEVLELAKGGYLEIMITTYTTYRLRKSQINTVCWDCVIADECHTIKERKSEVTKAMNEVNSLCRIGLTGTAIQNKYEELWTILNWASPGTFGPISTWKQSVCNPLKDGQSHNATIHELAKARFVAKQLVNNLLPQFFLRRMKSLIKDQLPKKTDRVVFCPFTATQAQAYQNFLDSDYVEKIKNSSEMCDCDSGKKAGWCCHMYLENGDRWNRWVLPCLVYLQRLCNHLALLTPGSSDMDKQAREVELLTAAMPDQWQELVRQKDSMINYSNPEFCGKWRVLKKLLKFWDEQGGNKVLVFSHSVRLLKMLQALFLHTDFNVKYLDGSMSYDDRYAAVNDFNTGPTQFVFLISTKAGGVGLNITSANKVVIVDPNWNPSHDLQAQDRAYRIGQLRDVEVFRLVSQGTLEEIVYARQIYKQQMSNIGLSATDERRYFTGVMGKKDQKGEIFGLRNMFAYQGENVVLRDIVHKTNVAEAKADLHIANLETEEQEYVSDGEDGEHSNSQVKEEDDEGLSQLAQEIIGEPGKKGKNVAFASSAKKHDPVQAILASAGVSYTHENSEVVGTSRVEAALSKRAAEASNSQLESRVFTKDSQSQLNEYLDEEGGLKYRYRPPEDVMRRQFGAMAKWAGFEDVVEFALIVESWTQAERRDFLDKWYWYRRECMISGVKEYVSRGGEDVYVKREKEEEARVKVEPDDGVVKIEPKVEVVDSDEDDEL